jgi:hypothetical protein
VLFVRRVWGEHPEDTVEVKLRAGFRSQDEVTKMGRVERAAKETDLLSLHA